MGTGDDMKVCASLAGIGHKFHGRTFVINGDNQNLGIIKASCTQDIGAGGITKEAAKPKLTHGLNHMQITINHDSRKP